MKPTWWQIGSAGVLLTLLGCGFLVHERMKGGPYAVTYWRDTRPQEPTWAEIDSFKAQRTARVEQYLATHPIQDEKRKFWLQHLEVVRGMTPEEVKLIVGEPVEIIREPDKLQAAAKQYWRDLEGRTREAWIYQGVRHPRFTLFFDDTAVIDIIKTARIPL
jgi:hypothetical protein